MPNWLDIDTRSGVPIYIQLVEQIRHALETGILQVGDRLPTVRQLASDLTIAPNTIVKAYNELAHLNLVESRQGVGTVVVAGLNDTLRQQQQQDLLQQLQILVRDASHLEVDAATLRASFHSAMDQFYQVENRQETDAQDVSTHLNSAERKAKG